jgi:hypothetical protein
VPKGFSPVCFFSAKAWARYASAEVILPTNRKSIVLATFLIRAKNWVINLTLGSVTDNRRPISKAKLGGKREKPSFQAEKAEREGKLASSWQAKTGVQPC